MTRPPLPTDPADAPELWDALARFITGESEPDERAQIERWLAADPARRDVLDALRQSLTHLEFQPSPDLDVEAALQRVTARLPETDVQPIASRRRERPAAPWRNTTFRVAAGVALLLGGTLLYRATREEPAGSAAVASAITYHTRVGQMDSLRLPDGTRVVLAPGSEFTVPAGYGETDRTVALTGEALFDVTHDVNRPFTVRAGAAVILDLGTTFTVRSQDAGDEVRVVVTSGSVMLRADQAGDAGVVLRAGDRGVLGRDGRTVAERDVATADDVAWTRGQLVFQDASIDDVARDLRRWYGIELQLADSSLASRHVTATFQDEDAQRVLTVLELALGARIERRGDTAIVRINP